MIQDVLWNFIQNHHGPNSIQQKEDSFAGELDLNSKKKLESATFEA